MNLEGQLHKIVKIPNYGFTDNFFLNHRIFKKGFLKAHRKNENEMENDIRTLKHLLKQLQILQTE
jgi:hypothetical protein